MKRKLILMLASCLVISAFSGCGSDNTERVQRESYGANAGEDEQDDDDADGDTDDGNDNQDVKPDTDEQYYVVDSQNSTITVFDSDYKEVTTKSFLYVGDAVYPQCIGYYDGYAYLSTYSSSENAYELIRLDLFDMTSEIIDYFDANLKLDIIDGELYVTYTCYGDEGNSFYCTKYAENADGTYTKTPVYEKLCDALYGSSVCYSYSHGIAYAIENAGMYVTYNHDEDLIFGYDENGEIVCQFNYDSSDEHLVDYDANYMVLDSSRKEENKYAVTVISYYDDGIWDVFVGDRDIKPNVIGLKDGVLFYGVNDYTEYALTSYAIYAHNLSVGSNHVVDTIKCAPGMLQADSLGSESFTILDTNTCAYITSERERGETADGEVYRQWYIAKENPNSLHWDVNGTGLVTERFPVFDICKTIIYMEDSAKCRFCDEYAARSYSECIQIADGFENSDVVNELLKKNGEESFNAKFQNLVGADEYFTESDCETFHSATYSSMSTSQRNLSEACLVMNRYLVVTYRGYIYYAGAAHGMPFTECEMYDLEEGKEITFKDIYNGSMDDLYAAVATAAISEYDVSEYSWTYPDEKDFYNGVIECMKNDEYTLIPHEDYVEAEFIPYSLGSFAMGMPSFNVSYDELDMNF